MTEGAIFGQVLLMELEGLAMMLLPVIAMAVLAYSAWSERHEERQSAAMGGQEQSA